MIHIDRNTMPTDAVWLAEAAIHCRNICDCATEEDRSVYVNQHAAVWSDRRIKNALEEKSHRKCWYCEAREKRSDRHVDHYRPKNRVHGTSHGGYWWLAFDYRNYHLACTYCNFTLV